jgi:hypothetical protein
LNELQRRIQDLALQHDGTLVLTRRSFADHGGKSGKPRYALPFLEVRITACPLPVTADSSLHDFSFHALPLAEVLEQLGELIGTTLALSQDVYPATSIDFSCRQSSAAEALALLLLQNDLYFAPVSLGSSVLRSYEYRSKDLFVRAVRGRLAEADRARAPGPYLVMPLAEWVRLNRTVLQRLHVDTRILQIGDRTASDRLIGAAELYLRRLLELRCRRNRPRSAPSAPIASNSPPHQRCSPPPSLPPA